MADLGDLVEHHAPHRYFRLQVLNEVPRDRFTLAVFVGREIQGGCFFQRCPELSHDLSSAFCEFVGGFESIVDIDGEPFAREVCNMANGGAHFKCVAEILWRWFLPLPVIQQ